MGEFLLVVVLMLVNRIQMVLNEFHVIVMLQLHRTPHCFLYVENVHSIDHDICERLLSIHLLVELMFHLPKEKYIHTSIII